MTTQLPITAIILAGGQGRRMGYCNKGLIELEGRPLFEHVIERIKPQVSDIIISANADHEHYRRSGLTVVADEQPSSMGPLAGIAAGLKHVHSKYALIVPCDCPFVPLDLAQRMYDAVQQHGSPLCLCRDPQRLQPLFALIHTSLLPNLIAAIDQGRLKVERWMTEQPHCIMQYDNPDVFFNINTPDQLDTATTQISQN